MYIISTSLRNKIPIDKSKYKNKYYKTQFYEDGIII